MNLELVLVVLFGIYLIISLVDIPLTIWSNKLKANEQSKNSTCIYVLYKELKRYNDLTFGEVERENDNGNF